ncbi:MAG: amidophosphoribosyltransferase [Deltaproteobacteria bacterium]|jgi:amidophosphoribosyltransferase|nr:amidophosphoribosyltransferase [Deltaproteobacteria bacterium]
MCGIFGIFDHDEAANLTYLGLSSLQHRGQEATGIACINNDGTKMEVVKRGGLVAEGFGKEEIRRLKGKKAVGHVRYSTTGASIVRNAQPLYVNYRHGDLALVHNGNLLQSAKWRTTLEDKGAIFQSVSDTEILIHLMSRSDAKTLKDRVVDALSRVRGAYSLLFLGETGMVAARDPWGYRPLVIGKIDNSWVFSSETCAFSLINAQFVRSVEPGEVVLVNENGLQSFFPFKEHKNKAKCIFEHVYFARPDTNMFGHSVYKTRVRSGRILAREHSCEADLVIPVPDSGIAAAIGYAEKSKIPFAMGLIRSHYVGRTFIEPSQSIRSFGVKLKLSPVKDLLEGKRVVVVDDSLVRGTTSRKIMDMIREAGAKEIHLRIACPPVTHSCFYGIDTPTREELLASSKNNREIANFVHADTLGYLSKAGLLDSMGDKNPESIYCTACFDGNYPQSPSADLATNMPPSV